ncbi:MAG: HEAT repeat domain-containing protein [Chloroflexi bacterium]|nr:HEAT repeat domain-containing protein [Chloroflexota bacterium]
MTRDLSPLFTHLQDPQKPLGYQQLSILTDLNTSELQQFRQGWQVLPAFRRLEFLQALTEMAEEHIEFDFRNIFFTLLHEEDPQTRVLAIEGLWEEDRLHLIPELCRLLEQDDEYEVRAAAASALGRFVYLGEVEKIDPRHTETVKAILRRCFHDPQEHVHVRRRALESIATCSDADIETMIENAFYSDDLDMRSSALYAMGQNADQRWTPYLLEGLHHAAPALRLEAVRALGLLEVRGAVTQIARLLEQELDLEVRLAAIEALGQIGGSEARKALEWITGWDDEASVTAAEAALEESYLSEGPIHDLINEILEESGWSEDFLEDEFFEDPLEAEIRQLLEERDDWLRS